MLLLHLSDIHVGKTLRGVSRADEHRALFVEAAGIVTEREVDVVAITGDLFDSSSPSAESELIMMAGLGALVSTGCKVIIIAGNHDHPTRWTAMKELFGFAGVEVIATPFQALEGPLVVPTRNGDLVIVNVPFLSQRNVVSGLDLMVRHDDENKSRYSETVRQMVTNMSRTVSGDMFRVGTAHLTVTGGMTGGGERLHEITGDYQVPVESLTVWGDRPGPQYVALGHLHRPQQLGNGQPPVRYAGSPIHLDFGEEGHNKSFPLIKFDSPHVPATVELIPIRTGRTLKTFTGTLDQILGQAQLGLDDLTIVRCRVEGDWHAGIADTLRREIPGVIQVVPMRTQTAAVTRGRLEGQRVSVSPAEMVNRYATEIRGVTDPTILAALTETVNSVNMNDTAIGTDEES